MSKFWLLRGKFWLLTDKFWLLRGKFWPVLDRERFSDRDREREREWQKVPGTGINRERE